MQQVRITLFINQPDKARIRHRRGGKMRRNGTICFLSFLRGILPCESHNDTHDRFLSRFSALTISQTVVKRYSSYRTEQRLLPRQRRFALTFNESGKDRRGRDSYGCDRQPYKCVRVSKAKRNETSSRSNNLRERLPSSFLFPFTKTSPKACTNLDEY